MTNLHFNLKRKSKIHLKKSFFSYPHQVSYLHDMWEQAKIIEDYNERKGLRFTQCIVWVGALNYIVHISFYN